MNKLVFMLLIFCCFHFSVSTDSAPVLPSPGGTVMPESNNDIALQREVITIQIYRENYKVTVNYLFKNHGNAQEVVMGFPNEEGMMGETN